MTIWKNSEQNERKFPDGTIWVGKAEDPIVSDGILFLGKNGRAWRILEIDQEENRILLISEEAVCKKPYHEADESCTWKTCSLRKWLNTEFLESEFSEEEAEAICLTHLPKPESYYNNTDGGEPVDDKLFLLNSNEYFYTMCRTSIEMNYTGDWWTRSPGKNRRFVAFIPHIGYPFGHVARCTKVLEVRPAFMLNMNSEFFRSSSVVNEKNELCFVDPEIVIKNGAVIHGSEKCRNIELPPYVKKVRQKAFRNCRELRSVTWAGEMPVIEAEAFVDCPQLILPEEFYHCSDLLKDCFAAYMPFRLSLMPEVMIKSSGLGDYWEYFSRHLTAENAVYIADEVLKRVKEKKGADYCERLLRFALACAPVLGKERLKAVQKYLSSARYTGITWQPLLQREIEKTEPAGYIAKAILKREIVPAEIIRSEWREYARLPSFAEILYAVSSYAEQYSKQCMDSSRHRDLKIDYQKDPEAESYGVRMNHGALMSLLYKWGEWIDPRWYAPYAAYANDLELSILLENIDSRDVEYNEFSVRGAVLLNDTVTARRFADEKDLLGLYAEMRNMDEDDIRDNSISDFGLDENGKRSWTLAGKTFTAVVNKDLTVTLTDEEGTVYSSIPEIGTDLEKCILSNAEYLDLKESLLPTAKLRNVRIFEDFLSGRKREAGSWKKAYLKKVVLRILAKLIVWDQDGCTFTLDSSGRAVTADGTPYTVTDAPIAVAHPMEMGRETTEAWQTYFTARQLKQPFEQVWEPVKDPLNVLPGRYDGYGFPLKMLEEKKKHGIIYGLWEDFQLKGCHADLNIRTDDYEIRNFRYDEWNRQVNHIVAYFDKYLITTKIENDDVGDEHLFDGFTLAQITEFIDLAQKHEAHNALASLMEYKNTHFGSFDPMTEFTLDLE